MQAFSEGDGATPRAGPGQTDPSGRKNDRPQARLVPEGGRRRASEGRKAHREEGGSGARGRLGGGGGPDVTVLRAAEQHLHGEVERGGVGRGLRAHLEHAPALTQRLVQRFGTVYDATAPGEREHALLEGLRRRGRLARVYGRPGRVAMTTDERSGKEAHRSH